MKILQAVIAKRSENAQRLCEGHPCRFFLKPDLSDASIFWQYAFRNYCKEKVMHKHKENDLETNKSINHRLNHNSDVI
ncbi:MAG: hypothetical protein AAF915_10210 [Cyanobacteria bacterium P01_D01_bin.50]